MEEQVLDLSKEKAERLEAVNSRFGHIWRKHKYKNLAIYFGGCVFFAACFTGLYYMEELRFNNWIFIVFLYIGIPIFLGYTIYVIIILLSSVPLAPQSEEGSIAQFFSKSLSSICDTSVEGTPLSSFLESYVCLLDQVKEKNVDYYSFCNNMKERFGKIFSFLKDKTGTVKGLFGINIDINDPDYVNFEEISRTDQVATYKYLVRLDAKDVPSEGTWTRVSKGTVVSYYRLTFIVHLAKIGSRWYLSDMPEEKIEEIPK